MILSDFLLRQKHNDSHLHEIIQILFNMHNILYERYYNIAKSDRYLVQMQSQTKSSRIKLLKHHGVSKNLDPNSKLSSRLENPSRETKFHKRNQE